ncbi:MAG: hypothetical protein MH204_07780 [Fimbriimonadaceae bacterium]|nr:hypothetical protein [Fimbriimonadaceae bacterium]
MATIHEIVEAYRQGLHVPAVTKVRSGWVVLGETQITTGYCLLLPDPVVSSLNEMGAEARAYFLRDMARVGDALLATADAERINYEILGNVEPVLHAHIIPRYSDEDEILRPQPVWLHDWEAAPGFDLDEHGGLADQIRAALKKIVEEEDRQSHRGH